VVAVSDAFREMIAGGFERLDIAVSSAAVGM
jgi:hypothetical protein